MFLRKNKTTNKNEVCSIQVNLFCDIFVVVVVTRYFTNFKIVPTFKSSFSLSWKITSSHSHCFINTEQFFLSLTKNWWYFGALEVLVHILEGISNFHRCWSVALSACCNNLLSVWTDELKRITNDFHQKQLKNTMPLKSWKRTSKSAGVEGFNCSRERSRCCGNNLNLLGLFDCMNIFCPNIKDSLLFIQSQNLQSRCQKSNINKCMNKIVNLHLSIEEWQLICAEPKKERNTTQIALSGKTTQHKKRNNAKCCCWIGGAQKEEDSHFETGFIAVSFCWFDFFFEVGGQNSLCFCLFSHCHMKYKMWILRADLNHSTWLKFDQIQFQVVCSFPRSKNPTKNSILLVCPLSKQYQTHQYFQHIAWTT